jgi:hypothetical protein
MSNTCTCPGAETTCPDGQLAICRHYRGICHGNCESAPENLTRLQLQNWVLKTVMNSNRTLDRQLTTSDLKLLQAGFYRTLRPNGEVMTVSFNIDNLRSRLG